MSSNPARRTGELPGTASQWWRRSVVALVLLYALAIPLHFVFNSPFVALGLLLVPVLLASALFGIFGGISGALLGTLIVSLKVTLDSGWPWPAESQAVVVLALVGFYGLGTLVGLMSHRGRIRVGQAETGEQGRQFLAVLEHAPLAVIVADRGGFLRVANDSALDALGLKAPIALGQDIASIVPDKALSDLFYAATLGDQPVSGEVSSGDGHTLSVQIRPVPGVGSVAVLHDITHLKQLGQRKREMVKMVSHDLKNPLTAIQGYADLVLKMGQLDERQQKFVERIRFSASRMIESISDLLDVAWIEAGIEEVHRERVDFSAILQEALGQFQLEAAAKSLDLTARIADADAHVIGDGVRLRQMVDNLFGSAIKYTGEGGKIVVSLRREGDSVLCQVEDNGVGITPENLEKVFERYFRVDESAVQVGGSGLGLPIVRAIAEQHGGTVAVESEQGKGSTFTVKIPAASA